jgi:hypothetical protein
MTMDVFVLGKKIIGQLLVMIFIITSCTPADMPTATTSAQLPGDLETTSGSGAGGSDDVNSGTSLPPKVEIRHLIEPNLSTDPNYHPGTGHAGGGSYVRKLTLPKNFAGRLYVAGINIGTLNSRHVKVRFKFGMNREAVTIPATVSQAPGITPQTNISVLVLDLRGEPFRNIRLPYDLFDYNEYDFSAGDTPVQDNRDSGLYCRGLRIEDDPTFQGVGACDGLQSNPSQPDEQCLYAYAKVLDQGLVKVSGGVKVPIAPSLPQVKGSTSGSYYQDSMSLKILKPLPDTMPTAGSHTAGPFVFSQAASSSSTDSVEIIYKNVAYSAGPPVVPARSIWDPLTILGSSYYYRGPYRLVNSGEWQFKFAELDGPNRLFRENSWVDYPLYLTDPLPDDNQSFPSQNRIYYSSYLFPLATKLSLGANVPHLSSSNVDGTRVEQSLMTAGTTQWMDGSNARAQSRNSDLEHIGSCNVSASIEIIAKDDNGVDYVIALSKDVKLQLVRPTQYRTDTGNEVLYSNFKSCSSNSTCGGSECCFNNRCWDQSLVSQCFDSTTGNGNRIVGESCSTDLECSSLCCNRATGQCAPHNTLLSPAVLCSKPIGDTCIAKEWCQKSTVVKCLVVKTGTDSQGNVTCRQHCYNSLEYGDCKNGTCVAPTQETIPVFDPNAEGACDNAVPAPNF